MGLIMDCFAGGGGASVGIEMALGRDVYKRQGIVSPTGIYFMRYTNAKLGHRVPLDERFPGHAVFETA